jgi:drug/metabolite transporter (DMT)-like permease
VPDLAGTDWRAIPLLGWLALLYVSVLAMGVGWLVWNRPIARIEVTQVAIFSNLTPVFALGLSALLLGERITLPLLGGWALVVVGTYLTQRT